MGKPVLYIDTERTLTRETIEGMGVQTDLFYLVHVDNLEMALDVCKVAGQAGTFGALVIDSLTGLAPKAQMDSNAGNSYTGLSSRILSHTLPVLTPILNDSGCTLIVITQLRERVDVMFGNPEKATGGRALKYYASVRLEVRRVETLKQNGEIIGACIRIKVVKNKIATPLKEVEFDIIFGKGISIEGDILDQAVQKGIITKRGAWYFHGEEQMGLGKENVKQYLQENPEEQEEIRQQIFAVSE